VPALSRYVALGDSVSIDLYPALDAGAADVAVALERTTTAGEVAPLGAASLLYRNADEVWPDELGADLFSTVPGIGYENLASDAATVGEVFGEQLTSLAGSDERALITLTIGGNDLLSAFGNRPRPGLLERIVGDIIEAYEVLVDAVRGRTGGGLLLLSTVYDPSDGTGRIPGVYDELPPLPLDALERFNTHVRTLARGTPGVLLADVHAHFLGYGVSAPEADRWYWRRSLIEPNARGASEIRRLWYETLVSER
jgi:lysophospholipase L1-like esterase